MSSSSSSSVRQQGTIRVSLEREGVGQHELQLQQVTVENLRRLFQVSPSEAWLRDEIDDTAYFPQQDESFDLLGAGVTQYTHLIVEGRNLESQRALSTSLAAIAGSMSLSSTPAAASSATLTARGQQSSSSLPSPFFRSVIAPKRAPSFNLKVVKAKVHRNGRKTEFQPIHQTFIELVDSTANVEHILAIIRRRWGPDYILVTQDGLPLEDAPATQELGFWKCARRRVYAVLQQDEANTVDSSNDEDYEPGPVGKRREVTNSSNRSDIQIIKEDIEELKSRTTDTATNLPLGLQSEIRGSFKCTICHVLPIKPPVILAKCCKSIIGCEQCINQWYGGPDGLMKTCPLCRTERAFTETMRLNGLEGFISSLASIFPQSTEGEEEQ